MSPSSPAPGPIVLHAHIRGVHPLCNRYHLTLLAAEVTAGFRQINFSYPSERGCRSDE
jgi:hypothetical protein